MTDDKRYRSWIVSGLDEETRIIWHIVKTAGELIAGGGHTTDPNAKCVLITERGVAKMDSATDVLAVLGVGIKETESGDYVFKNLHNENKPPPEWTKKLDAAKLRQKLAQFWFNNIFGSEKTVTQGQPPAWNNTDPRLSLKENTQIIVYTGKAAHTAQIFFRVQNEPKLLFGASSVEHKEWQPHWWWILLPDKFFTAHAKERINLIRVACNLPRLTEFKLNNEGQPYTDSYMAPDRCKLNWSVRHDGHTTLCVIFGPTTVMSVTVQPGSNVGKLLVWNANVPSQIEMLKQVLFALDVAVQSPLSALPWVA